MTQDEIIEMARESGLETQDGFSESVFYFAKLVAEKQQRTWVGLTEDEREDLYCKYHDEAGYAKAGYPDGWDYERAIEDKLKEKNT